MSDARPSDRSIVAIIPLYNGSEWIERSLCSVLDQTLPPDEIVVVDDGSTDGGQGELLVRRIQQKHGKIVLLEKQNGGQESSRNFGVKNSKSSLIAFLDQDDVWYPNHLQRLLQAFQLYRGGLRLGWVYSNLDEINGHGTLVRRNFLDTVPASHPKIALVDCIRQDMFVLPSASLISREAFDAVGGFDERLAGYEDDDLFLRMFSAGYANIYIDEPLSQWCIHSGSTSFTDRMARSRMIYAHKLIETFPDDPMLHRYWIREYIVPRFVKNLHGQLAKSLIACDRKSAHIVGKDFRSLIKHLGLRSRLKHRTIFALLHNRSMAKGAIILHNRPRAQRIAVH